jgi:hypothetical protein
MSETIAVLFIFFVLVVFGIIFYVKYSQIAAEGRQEELLGMKAMDITIKSLFLPELICSRGEAEPIDNCIDLLKLNHADEIFKGHVEDYYFNLFSYSKINITRVYPTHGEWILYEKEKTKIVDGIEVPNWKNRELSHFVISLRDEIESESRKGKFSFGILTIEVYS